MSAKLWSKTLFFCLLVAFMPIRTFSVSAVTPSSISTSVAPSNPKPNENVTISLSSYAANLDSVSISWFVNGKGVLSGIGEKKISITAGASGSRTTVVAKIALPDGEIDKNIIISPSVMVVLWQATDSYVPPFYKGKALLPAESEVKIVALPEIKTGSGIQNPKNMTYSWTKDYTNVAGAAGYGKNSFTFVNDYLDDANNIGVVASTLDQSYSSEGSIDVNISQPKISFYRKDSALGTIWERALLDGHQVSGSEIVVATPYFATPKALWRPELTFSWFINNVAVSISGGAQKDILPLQVQGGTSGTSKVRVDVENTDKISETISRGLDVNF